MDMDMDVDMEDEPQMKIVKNYQRPDVRWAGWMPRALRLWLHYLSCTGGGEVKRHHQLNIRQRGCTCL